MAYSVDLRKKVTNYIGEGHTIQEAHEVFKVGTTTIKEWKKLLNEQGTLEKRPLKRGHKKVCEVIFLPPYSPDLNPIEKFWAWLKQKLKSVLFMFQSFDDALMDCFQVK